MSVRARPLLHEVIPMIDVIEAVLKQAADDGVLETETGTVYLKPAVRVAASLGCDVLNRYYSKTDDSIMYRCAMSMSMSIFFLIHSLTHVDLSQSCTHATRQRTSSTQSGFKNGSTRLSSCSAKSGSDTSPHLPRVPQPLRQR